MTLYYSPLDHPTQPQIFWQTTSLVVASRLLQTSPHSGTAHCRHKPCSSVQLGVYGAVTQTFQSAFFFSHRWCVNCNFSHFFQLLWTLKTVISKASLLSAPVSNPSSCWSFALFWSQTKLWQLFFMAGICLETGAAKQEK